MIMPHTIDPDITTVEITDYASLQQSIRQLKVLKLHQKEMLRADITGLVSTLNPVELVKDSLHNLVTDKGVQFDLVKMGLNLSAELISARLFGRYSSLPVFLGLKAVEKIGSFFLKGKTTKVNTAIRKMLAPGSESISTEEIK